MTDIEPARSTRTPASVGTCPRCSTAIPGHRVLIEYETDDGPDSYAECPACGDVVTPT